MKTICLLVAALVVGCDDDKPAATSSPVASSTPPTPEKGAGVEQGAVKLCVVPKAAKPTFVNVVVSPTAPEGDPPMQEKWVTLNSEEHGYCGFVQPDFSHLWGSWFMVKATDVPLDEVGVYYLKDWKENPAAGDLTYAKATKTDDGSFVLGVLISSATIPTIQIVVKE